MKTQKQKPEKEKTEKPKYLQIGLSGNDPIISQFKGLVIMKQKSLSEELKTLLQNWISKNKI